MNLKVVDWNEYQKLKKAKLNRKGQGAKIIPFPIKRPSLKNKKKNSLSREEINAILKYK